MTTIRLFFAMTAIRHWPSHQLDIKNAFCTWRSCKGVYTCTNFLGLLLGGSLVRFGSCVTLYDLKQSPRGGFGKFSSIVQTFGLKCNEANH